MRWIVKEDGPVGDSLKKAFRQGQITPEDIEVIRVWVKQVEGFGPRSLRKTWSLKEATQGLGELAQKREESAVNFWNDHDLVGEWSGHRSSSFSRLGRIIYKIEDERIQIVKVMKITASHEY
jgi:mRNA-degrading endonuclease YafQ of YafQ-DinJ toxin-antitoxin module